MKIHGMKVVAPPSEEIVVIPRPTGDLVFKAKMIESYDAFNAICPTPEMPSRMEKGGVTRKVPDDPKYNEALNTWATHRSAWMFIKSLEPTGIEWTTVDMTNPDTWSNFESELTEAGFSQMELMRIMQIIQDANGLNQSKIDEATARFLATPLELRISGASPADEQNSTQSGAPVKGSN